MKWDCDKHDEVLRFGCFKCRPVDYPHREEREKAIAFAREMVGVTPFHHAGRDPKTGVDCSGLIATTAWHIGASFTRWIGYPRGIANEHMRTLLAENLHEVPREELLPADILFVRVKRAAVHTMLFTDVNTIIHSKYRSTVVESTLDERWADRIMAVYRYKELVDG